MRKTLKSMNYQDFLLELFYSTMAITGPGLSTYMPMLKKILEGEQVQPSEIPPLQSSAFNIDLDEVGPDDNDTGDNVAVIPIRGVIMKYGCWWCYGAEDYARLIRIYMDDPNVKAIILRIHSPGGSTSARIPFNDVLVNRTKPVIALVDNVAMSLGYWIGSLCDEIIAIDKMAQVGSIGVFARLIDDTEMLKMWGIKEIEIYAPESKWKNKAINEALDNKPKLLQQEELSPMAIEFQNNIRSARPNLDEEIEGILEGRVFYASDALNHGMINSILTLEQTIKRAFTLSERQNITNSI